MKSEITPDSHHNSEGSQFEVKIEQPTPYLNQKPKQSNSSLKEKLDDLSQAQHQPTIYKVHNELRNIKKEAYEPLTIAIGPYHSHNENLKNMEIHKLRYLKSLLGQEKKIEDCVAVMKRSEPDARKCYAEHIDLDSTKFIEMLVLDGCFIIEFARRYSRLFRNKNDKYFSLSWMTSPLENENDQIFSLSWMTSSIMRDLLLFENQVPFFILFELINFVFDRETSYHELFILLKFPWQNVFPLKMPQNQNDCPTKIKYLLELIYECLEPPREDQKSEETHKHEAEERLIRIGSATSLAECNVKFESVDKVFQINFENGCMRLPHLTIEDNTESYLRNFIAHEQYTGSNHVGDYITFMDDLINTSEDVKLLVECRVLENWLGSEKDIANMFNKLCDGTLTSSENFTYQQQCDKVNKHCNAQCNKWIATLKKNHLNNPWAIISIIAGFVLIVLTAVQTVFAIIN